MKNQFNYTHKLEDKEVEASFSINKVVRTVRMDEGLVVVLDDWHQERRQVAVPGNGKPKFEIRNMDICSEILIHKEDEIARFKELLSI